MHKKVTKRMHLTLHFMVHLKVLSSVGRKARLADGSSEDMPNGVLQDLYKDARKVHLRLKLRVDFR